MLKSEWTCSRCGRTSTSTLICLCPEESPKPPSDWEVGSSKFVSSKPKEEMLKDIRNSSADRNRLEIYTILKDNKRFASFTEGEESRLGNPMSYEEFLKEYNLCVFHWEKNCQVSPKRFSYIIEYM